MEKQNYAKEFPGFGDLPFDPTLYGYTDASWHNDACPCFVINGDERTALGPMERLWIDFAQPGMRELGGVRFGYVLGDDNMLFESEDSAAMEKFIRQRTIERIAGTFADLLMDHLPHEKFVEVLKRNENYGEGICASHDFCDANMVMQEAMENCGIKLFEDENQVAGEMQEFATGLWNASWDVAKHSYLSGMTSCLVMARRNLEQIRHVAPDGSSDTLDGVIKALTDVIEFEKSKEKTH